LNKITIMTLIASISGIRGTIGGQPGDNLTPQDIIKFVSGFGMWIREQNPGIRKKVITGRDARVSGPLVNQLVASTFCALGIDVIDIGPASTPTVEMAVMSEKADGGVIITASHNPAQWNALKLLNSKGEFISAADGAKVLDYATRSAISYAAYNELGTNILKDGMTDSHIREILKLPAVNTSAISAAGFTVAVDAVNSVGGICVPQLLKALGVKEVIEIHCEPTGLFAHNPEPLPENLQDLSRMVVEKKAHLGFCVDPDVDRLAVVCEDGSMFGEEYTLVAVSDYILKRKKGNTVSNLSSSRALNDVTEGHGGKRFSSAVGEVNVVNTMKEQNAVIGGEGNGGVIYPDLHYGRDALVGIALFLSHLAESKCTCSELRKKYPDYYISKNKVELQKGLDVASLLNKLESQYPQAKISRVDGLHADFGDSWVHIRSSNTEPILRIYSEASSEIKAQEIAEEAKVKINKALAFL
jgi:phosphomannomutase